MDELTEEQQAMIELERTWWKHSGRKEAFVRDRFGWSMTRYYVNLNQLLDLPAAMAFDPLVVKRLRRLRQQRKVDRFRALL